MAYKYKLKEQDGEEVSPSSRGQVDYNLVLTPKSAEVEEVVKALENIDNYGIYVANMRNKSSIQKAIEDHFGPVIPAKRKQIEKQRGVPFPVKTKQAIDDFVKSLTSKPTLLKYKVSDNTIVFPKGSNPAKDLTKKIIDVVMKNAKIDYSIADKEAIDEAKEVKVGSIVGNTVQGFDFKVLAINGDKLEVEDTKTGKKMTTYIDNMYLPTVKETVDETSVDKLDQEAKIYFMQQVKQGKIKELPKDPKTEYMKIKMSKDNLKEIIREKLAKILK